MGAKTADTGMDGARIVAEYSTVLPRPGEVESVVAGSRMTFKEVVDIGVTLVTDSVKDLVARRREASVDRSGQV